MVQLGPQEHQGRAARAGIARAVAVINAAAAVAAKAL
jgi:hypothetical protein